MGGGDVADKPDKTEASETPMSSPQSSPRSLNKGRSTSTIEEDEVNISLSDYMAEVAAEQGFVFRPKGRTTQLGKQVYQFGAVSVYFDKDMVYATPKGTGDWIPVSFDEVLKLAK